MKKLKEYFEEYKYFLIAILILSILFIISSVGFIYFYNKKQEVVEIEKEVIKEVEPEKKEEYYVDIKGFISKPGVYKVSEGKRVNDIINLAGGLLKEADTSAINLSMKIKDEMVIIIYSKDQINKFSEEKKKEIEIQKKCSEGITIGNDVCTKNNVVSEPAKNVSGKININTASEEELLSLSGIGESKAIAIIKYREENGDFKKIEDIMNVSGIGEAAFAKIKENITV